jgi:mono/diheme cytochrome c family protein
MRYTSSAIMGVVLIAGVAALAPGPAVRSAAQEEATEASRTPNAAIPKPLMIPKDAHERENPVPHIEKAITMGRNLYASQCAMCHGAKGEGRGDLAVTLKLTIPDFRSPAVQEKRTDGDLFYIMSIGHGDMPGEKRLVDQSKWEIVHYLRTLRSGAGKK